MFILSDNQRPHETHLWTPSGSMNPKLRTHALNSSSFVFLSVPSPPPLHRLFPPPSLNPQTLPTLPHTPQESTSTLETLNKFSSEGKLSTRRKKWQDNRRKEGNLPIRESLTSEMKDKLVMVAIISDFLSFTSVSPSFSHFLPRLPFSSPPVSLSFRKQH